jgi:hypothetical protein
MNYATLEEAYGTPFGARKTVEETAAKEAPAKASFTSLAKKAEASKEKNQSLIDSLLSSLPLAEEPEERPTAQRRRDTAREHFATSQPAGVYEGGKPTPHDEADKVSRILRLVEQNRTGYERPAVQDIGLYIFTGIFFLFTFDTFVEIGKTMGRYRM